MSYESSRGRHRRAKTCRGSSPRSRRDASRRSRPSFLRATARWSPPSMATVSTRPASRRRSMRPSSRAPAWSAAGRARSSSQLRGTRRWSRARARPRRSGCRSDRDAELGPARHCRVDRGRAGTRRVDGRRHCRRHDRPRPAPAHRRHAPDRRPIGHLGARSPPTPTMRDSPSPRKRPSVRDHCIRMLGDGDGVKKRRQTVHIFRHYRWHSPDVHVGDAHLLSEHTAALTSVRC